MPSDGCRLAAVLGENEQLRDAAKARSASFDAICAQFVREIQIRDDNAASLQRIVGRLFKKKKQAANAKRAAAKYVPAW